MPPWCMSELIMREVCGVVVGFNIHRLIHHPSFRCRVPRALDRWIMMNTVEKKLQCLMTFINLPRGIQHSQNVPAGRVTCPLAGPSSRSYASLWSNQSPTTRTGVWHLAWWGTASWLPRNNGWWVSTPRKDFHATLLHNALISHHLQQHGPVV